jgi:pSer/pThr/pTyr-binding forkhead associated (FHA) protein
MLRVSEYGATDPAELQFEGDTITIGRGRSNDLTLPDRKVSKQHAEIRVQNERCYVVDLNSKNKTFVGEEEVRQEPHLLETGDAIHIGDFKIVFSKSLSSLWSSESTIDTQSEDAGTFDRSVVRLVYVLQEIAKSYGSMDESTRDEKLRETLRAGLDTRVTHHPIVKHVIDILYETRQEQESSGRSSERPWSLF